MSYVMMALASLVGGIIQPLTGFGAAVIMMVAATAYYDITVAPTLVALICAAQSGTMTWLYRRHIDLKQIALPIALYTVCSLVVISLLGSLNLRTLHIAFGAFLVALAVYFLFFARRVKLKPSLTSGLVCSAFSGCCAGAFTIGGPMMALYFVAIARDNARKAGVEDVVRFEVADMRNFRRDDTYGQLVTNPPYGERLLERQEAEALYRDFGKMWERLPDTWRTLVQQPHGV